MAFVAGVVLMYLPEEPAFQVLARLMGPGGPDLRALFLPGLEGLKQLLRCFEWLMARLMPELQAHLQARARWSALVSPFRGPHGCCWRACHAKHGALRQLSRLRLEQGQDSLLIRPEDGATGSSTPMTQCLHQGACRSSTEAPK